jgi:hypothetical protein
VGDLRRELDEGASARHVELREWLALPVG